MTLRVEAMMSIIREVLRPDVHVTAALLDDGRRALAAFDAGEFDAPAVWGYDPETRRLYDENGVTIAEQVCAGDAFAILARATPGNPFDKGFDQGFADGHGEGVAILLEPLRGMVDAYWRGSEDSDDKHAPTMVKAALDGIAAAEDFNPDAKPAPALAAVLADMLAWEAESFDGDPDTDLQVSGADLVDAFTAWRGQIRQALAARSVAGTTAPDLIALDRGDVAWLLTGAESYADDLATGLEDGTYEDDPGCERIADAAERVKAALDAPRAAAEPVRIGVHLAGGVVQDIWSDVLLPGVTVTLYDFDVEGSERKDVRMARAGMASDADEWQPVAESEWSFTDSKRHLIETADATEGRFDAHFSA